MSFQAHQREIRCSSLMRKGSKHVAAFLVSQIVFASIWTLMATTVLRLDSIFSDDGLMMALQFFALTLVFSVQGKCPPISRRGEQLENVGIITFLQELMLGPFGGFCKKDYFSFHQLQSTHMTKAGAQIAATIQSQNQTFHNTACKTMCNNKTLSTS